LGLGLWALTDMNGGKLPSLEQIADSINGGGPSQASPSEPSGETPSLRPSEETPAGGSGGSDGSGGSAPSVGTPALPADAGHAVVRHVHDGDTLFLEDGRKVRLLGIDTPEVGDNRECYGDDAREALRAMLPPGTAVRTVADVRATDQYGRSLLFLFTQDGSLVNLDLIREGYAEAVVYKPNVLWSDL